jgi:hypothetical protein
MPPLEDSLSLRSRRGRIGPFLRPGDVASRDWRKHPFQAHPSQTLLLASPSQEPSFPSDHAVAAFAIAFSVALVRGRRAGVFFLAAASVVITRVFVGLHYPGDIAGGALIRLICARGVLPRPEPLVSGGRDAEQTHRSAGGPCWKAFDAAKGLCSLVADGCGVSVERRGRDSNPRSA